MQMLRSAAMTGLGTGVEISAGAAKRDNSGFYFQRNNGMARVPGGAFY